MKQIYAVIVAFFMMTTTLYSADIYAKGSKSYGGGFKSPKSSGSVWNRSSKPSSKPSYGYKSSKPAKPQMTAAQKAAKERAAKQKAEAAKKAAAEKKKMASFAKKPKTITSSTAKGLNRQQSKQLIAKVHTKKSTVKPAAYKSSPVYTSAPKMSPRTYTRTRDSYYSRVDYTPPAYVYHSNYSSFGAWDAMWMWMMLSSVNNHSWAYHHQNDPGYQEWRREADRLARDNAELRQQLASMDGNINSMQQKGVKIDETMMAKDVPAAVMYSQDVVSRVDTSKLTMMTGSDQSNYHRVCKAMQENDTLGLNIQCIPSNGSVSNLNALSEGNADMTMAQSDAIDVVTKKGAGISAYQSSVYNEVVYLLVNEDSGIDDIDDIQTGKHLVYALGSGAMTTLKRFGVKESNYAEIAKNAIQVDPEMAAVKKVAETKNAAMVYVCGMKCGLIQEANDRYGKNLKMVPIVDGDLDDRDMWGNTVYETVYVPRLYPELQEAGWVDDTTETVAVQSVLLLSKNWLKAKGLEQNEMNAVLIPALNMAKAEVGEPEESFF